MSTKYWIMLPAIILSSSAAYAGTAMNCSDIDGYDDKSVAYCVEQETRFMSDQLKQLSKTYTAYSWSKIQASQDAWRSYMNANCEFHKMNAGGGGAEIRALNECKVRMTYQRVSELETM